MPDPQYLSTDPNAGLSGYLSTDPNAGQQPDFKQTDTSPNDVDPNTIGTFVKHLWAGVNPVQIGQMLPWPKAAGGSGLDNPLNPNVVVRNMAAVKKTADEALKKGDYTKALTHYIESVVPVLGPIMAHQADQLEAGKYAAAGGDMTALTATAIAPKLLAGRRGVPATSPVTDFAQARNIPLDAATVSDNLAVKGAQAIADRSIGGSMVATPARARQAAAMERVGGELATEAHPVPTTPETAGSSLRQALTAKVVQHNQTATTAYDTLRQIEQQRGLSVDITRPKQALSSLYQDLMRQKELVPLQGDKGRALVALDRLMNGPDVAPLSTVDAALGDLKSMARANIPELRTQGQGAAAVAVKQLDAAVRQAAMRGGKPAVDALMEGRQATVAKYQVAEVLDAIHDEPVRTIRTLTAAKDASISQLRAVVKEVPDQAQVIARGFLEDLLEKPQKVAEWRKLGAETKQVLFPKAGQTEALDHFFALTDRISKTNVNPSGSGYVALLGTQGAMIWYDPIHAAELQISGGALAALLRSPLAIQALTRGVSMPRSAPLAAQVSATANLLKAAQSAGVPLPAAATDRPADSTPAPAVRR